jgi:hypothetical protein
VSTAQEARIEADISTKMLMNMAERSYSAPGTSWRVGVSAVVDPAALQALGHMGIAMIGKKTVRAMRPAKWHPTWMGHVIQPRSLGPTNM